jgi:hypothetical protein
MKETHEYSAVVQAIFVVVVVDLDDKMPVKQVVLADAQRSAFP